VYKILSKKDISVQNIVKKRKKRHKCTKYCKKKGNVIAMHFLVLNKCTKYSQKRRKCTKYCQKKSQEDRNKISAMHFFRWNLLG